MNGRGTSPSLRGGRDRGRGGSGMDRDRSSSRGRGRGMSRGGDRGGRGFSRGFSRGRGSSDRGGRGDRDGRGRGWGRGDRGSDRGGYRGGSRGGDSRDGRSFSRGGDRGGFRGGDRGGFRGGDRGGYRGGSRGGDSRDGRSFSRGGDRGGYDRGGDRGGYDRGGLQKRRPEVHRQDENTEGGHDDSQGSNQQFRKKRNFNPDGNNKQSLTTLSESIFKKGVGVEDKEKFIERSLLILDEYGIENVIQKGSGSRLVQACLKYGGTTSKEVIFLKIMKSNVEKIFTDNFGKYLVKKIMVHIKDKKLLSIFHTYIESNFSTLLANPNGKIALSGYVESMSEYRLLDVLKHRLAKAGDEDEMKERVAAILTNKTWNNSLDQFWLHHHWDVIPDESKRLVVEELKENLDGLIDTKINGILLYCKIFDFVELKDRTKMLKKCISKKTEELVKKNHNVMFLFVKITHSYDDSGNIASILYHEILSNFNAFIENQITVTYLFYILCEDFEKEFSAKFHPRLVFAIKSVLMVNSGKKPIERKLEEARQRLFTEESFREIIKPEFLSKTYDSTFICVLISMILSYFVKSETCKQGIQEFIAAVHQNTKSNLDAGESVDLNKTLLLSHPFTHRMVKKFIQAIGTASSEYKTELEGMIEGLVHLMIDNLSILLRTRTVFIFIALMENTSYQSWITKKIRDLPEVEELSLSHEPGLKILFKIINKH